MAQTWIRAFWVEELAMVTQKGRRSKSRLSAHGPLSM